VDNSRVESVGYATLGAMTALPQPPPESWTVPPPLNRQDYLALPEESDRHFELQEGSLIMVPSPTAGHQNAALELAVQIRQQLPDHAKVIQDIDVDLDLVPPDRPATIRRPDLVVVSRTAYERVRNGGTMLVADEIMLVVEIHSPGSHRTDSQIKHSEYADAGIGHYWMIDINDGPSLTACHLAGEFGYADAAPVKGVFETDTPFPARVDLTKLI
jgi:Uma2 family endonuclease